MDSTASKTLVGQLRATQAGLVYYFVKSSHGATIFKQQLQGALWK